MMTISLLQILQFSERRLFQYIKEAFNGDVVHLEGFYMAHIRDERLPWLVAHTDSHNEAEDKPILSSGTYIMAPEGIPADDRAGVFALLTLKDRIEANFLFCSGEEVGGLGAEAFVWDYKKILKKAPYLIEIDRRGCLEAVCYHDEFNQIPEFKKAILRAGFKPALGTFSDVSILTGATGVASVNLSAGFYHEHTCGEYLKLSDLHETIERIPSIIEALGKRHYRVKAFERPIFKKSYQREYQHQREDGKWVWDDTYCYWRWLPDKL